MFKSCLFTWQSLISGSRAITANVNSDGTSITKMCLFTPYIAWCTVFNLTLSTNNKLIFNCRWVQKWKIWFNRVQTKVFQLPLVLICLYVGHVWLTRPRGSLVAKDKRGLFSVYKTVPTVKSFHLQQTRFRSDELLWKSRFDCVHSPTAHSQR